MNFDSLRKPCFISTLSLIAVGSVCLYAPELLALSEGNRVAELKALTEETSKIVATFSWLIGTGSIVAGAYAAVASQNLKVAATSAVISLAAFKGPAFFTTTALI